MLASVSSGISTFSMIALLLSLFNIVDLLVANANNNNNQNNLNSNQANLNDNSNVESNANPGQSSANQAVITPPGVGRRRRADELSPGRLVLNKRGLRFRLQLQPCGNETSREKVNIAKHLKNC